LDKLLDWFSDSFLIYTKDGSEKSYVLIQQVSKHFLESNIYIRVPLRGATSYGDLYMDEENSIFLGHSLIEAYTYCEDQDWINIILTPSATIKAQKMGFTPSHHSFTNKNIKLILEENYLIFPAPIRLIGVFAVPLMLIPQTTCKRVKKTLNTHQA